jgi:hypothetical protein
MRFLSNNYLGSYNNQSSITASSGDPYNAFSDTTKYSFESEGQDTDGDTVSLQQDFSSEQTLDTIVILNCNFNDFAISIASGASFTDVTSQATLTLSQDGIHRLYKFPSAISFTEIKFEVDDTITPNQEKQVGAILAFSEIGSIERFKMVRPKGMANKKVIKLESGGVSVLYKGDIHWEFGVNTDLVSIQEEIDIVETIQNRQQDFFFWINDGYDGAEKVKQEPYRFQDFIRCAYVGDLDPMFYKNYLNKTASNKLKFKQVTKIDYFNPTL